MSPKSKSGSHRKVDTAKHRKRRKRELGNRGVKEEQRINCEQEFASRIKEEPGLATMLRLKSTKEGE